MTRVVFVYILTLLLIHNNLNYITASLDFRFDNILNIRGGVIPAASEIGGDYYEQFHLDYGKEDKVRIAGALRGFIRSGNIAGLSSKDPFLKWLHQHLESGPEASSSGGRLKPFYTADFGSRKDLLPGENSKLIIVQRKLKSDENGFLAEAPTDIDVEVREIWQPWLKPRCNFVVRYIVPNRTNIIKILEAKKKFHSEVEVSETKEGKKEVVAKMIFKPSFFDRILGKRNVIIKERFPSTVLQGSKSSLSTKDLELRSKSLIKKNK